MNTQPSPLQYPQTLRVKVTKLSRISMDIVFDYQLAKSDPNAFFTDLHVSKARLHHNDIVVVLRDKWTKPVGYHGEGYMSYAILLPDGNIGWVFVEMTRWAASSGWFEMVPVK